MNTFAKAVGLVATGALILAAPASADEGQILRENAANAIPGSYIVVLDDAAVAGRPTDRDRRAQPGARRGRRASVRELGPGLLGRDDARGGAGAVHRPGRRVRRAGPHRRGSGHPVAHAVVGPGPHRPARPAAQQLVHLPDAPARASRRTSSTPASGSRHSDFGGRARRRASTPSTTASNDRLQRPRHARRRHGRRHRPTASPRASSSSPSGCSTAPAAAPSSRVIAGIDWVTGNHAAGSRPSPT